jgi:predicted MFS family arabinose efflux permease
MRSRIVGLALVAATVALVLFGLPLAVGLGQKVNGRKRFIVIDTRGLLLVVVVLAASTQDRDGAKPVLLTTFVRTRVRLVFSPTAPLPAGCSTGRRPCCAPGCTSRTNLPTSGDSP